MDVSETMTHPNLDLVDIRREIGNDDFLRSRRRGASSGLRSGSSRRSPSACGGTIRGTEHLRLRSSPTGATTAYTLRTSGDDLEEECVNTNILREDARDARNLGVLTSSRVLSISNW